MQEGYTMATAMPACQLLLPLVLSLAGGLTVGLVKWKRRKSMLVLTAAVLAADLAVTVSVCLSPALLSLPLFTVTEGLEVIFRADTLGRLFALLFSFVWLMAGVAAFEYMEHEKDNSRFFCFYLIVGGVLNAACWAGNFFTYYILFELMTLTSMPLVLHSLSHEAVMAALKYLFYSMGGAFLTLFGFFLFMSRGESMTFAAGGSLAAASLSGVQLTAVFLMILGFSTKAGMFPMHGWLPTAHPVAPAPASAVLSGVITKAGVLGVIRTVYYVIGPDKLRGTWVQTAWIALTLVTVFMGSMMAYQEDLLKKRMAYSTVSQVSYVLFGLSLLHPAAFTGALLHVVFHSLVKDTLFLSAGAVIVRTGRTRVKDLAGVGKVMPVTMWCFTLVSVTLVGIPPTSAFVSKWYLAVGALETGIPVVSWLGPVVLLISALLTAGYLLTISIRAFLPDKSEENLPAEKCEAGWRMTVPMAVLTVLSVGLGVWPGPLLDTVNALAGLLF